MGPIDLLVAIKTMDTTLPKEEDEPRGPPGINMEMVNDRVGTGKVRTRAETRQPVSPQRGTLQEENPTMTASHGEPQEEDIQDEILMGEDPPDGNPIAKGNHKPPQEADPQDEILMEADPPGAHLVDLREDPQAETIMGEVDPQGEDPRGGGHRDDHQEAPMGEDPQGEDLQGEDHRDGHRADPQGEDLQEEGPQTLIALQTIGTERTKRGRAMITETVATSTKAAEDPQDILTTTQWNTLPPRCQPTGQNQPTTN